MFMSNDSAIPGIYTKDRNVGKDSHYQGCHMMLFTAHSAVKPEDTEGLGIFVRGDSAKGTHWSCAQTYCLPFTEHIYWKSQM